MRNQRRTLLTWVIGMLLVGAGVVSAAERPVLTEELAQRLISEEEEVLLRRVTIAVVIQGKAKLGDDFETENAARVVFIWNRTEDGRSVRRVEERTFFWNQRFGWFCFRPSYPRGGEAVDICSELEGIVRIR